MVGQLTWQPCKNAWKAPVNPGVMHDWYGLSLDRPEGLQLVEERMEELLQAEFQVVSRDWGPQFEHSFRYFESHVILTR